MDGIHGGIKEQAIGKTGRNPSLRPMPPQAKIPHRRGLSPVSWIDSIPRASRDYFKGIPGSGLPLVVRIWKWCTPAASGWSLVQTIFRSGVTSIIEMP